MLWVKYVILNIKQGDLHIKQNTFMNKYEFWIPSTAVKGYLPGLASSPPI